MPVDILSAIRNASHKAKASGALLSIDTESSRIQQDGLPFHLRCVANLARKPKKTGSLRGDKGAFNPFLPHEPDMFVCDLSATHQCLLNKFNVVENHALVVTKAYEPQQQPLTQADCHAIAMCLQAEPGLAFYNGGEAAGASVDHKHLQFIPSAGAAMEELAPFATLLQQADKQPKRLPTLPYEHRIVALPTTVIDGGNADEQMTGETLKQHYDLLMQQLQLIDGDTTRPHNLLLSRDWLYIVPRRQECSDGISINALAFVGNILVKSPAQHQQVIQGGLAKLLQATTYE